MITMLIKTGLASSSAPTTRPDYQLNLLRTQFNNPEPSTDLQAAVALWVEQAELAIARSERTIITLLLRMLAHSAFELPLILHVYQHYLEGFLSDWAGHFAEARQAYMQGFDLLAADSTVGEKFLAKDAPVLAFTVPYLILPKQLTLLKIYLEVKLADTLIGVSEYDKAEKLLTTALAKMGQPEYNLVHGWALSAMGTLKYFRGEIEASIECLLEGRKLSEDLGDINNLGKILNRLGACYLMQNRLVESRAILEECVTLRTSLGNTRDLGGIYVNLGIVYSALGEQQRCIDSYLLALTLFKQFNNQRSMALAHLNLAEAYKDGGQIEESLEAALAALKLLRELGEEKILLPAALALAAKVESVLGKMFEAESHLNEAHQLLGELERTETDSNAVYLANIYSTLNEAALQYALELEAFSSNQDSEKFYQLALTYLKKSRLKFSKLGDSLGEMTLAKTQPSLILADRVKALKALKNPIAQELLDYWWNWLKSKSWETAAELKGQLDNVLKYAQYLSFSGDKEKTMEIYRKVFGWQNRWPTLFEDSSQLAEAYIAAAPMTYSVVESVQWLERALALLKDSGSKVRYKEVSRQLQTMKAGR